MPLRLTSVADVIDELKCEREFISVVCVSEYSQAVCVAPTIVSIAVSVAMFFVLQRLGSKDRSEYFGRLGWSINGVSYMEISADDFTAISRARPICKFYKAGWCRKGIKCTNLHAKGSECIAEDMVMLPYVSRFRDSNGFDQITVRSPLPTALKSFLKEGDAVGTFILISCTRIHTAFIRLAWIQL